MTSRQKFERWAKRRLLSLNTVTEVTRNGPRRFYVTHDTAVRWDAWQAGRRAR